MTNEKRIADALATWCAGYDKADAFTGGNNADEAELIRLAGDGAPALDCILYRGSGVNDGVPSGILDGTVLELPPSKRLVSSWTTDIAVARTFMEDAIDDNHSAILIGVHASRLQVVLDTRDYPGVDCHGESEVLVRNLPLPVGADDILEAWAYDADLEECRQLDRVPAMTPG